MYQNDFQIGFIKRRNNLLHVKRNIKDHFSKHVTIPFPFPL